MLDLPDFNIELASWAVDETPLREVRTVVFINEQNVPEEEEFDDDDITATHFLAKAFDGRPVGTARLTTDGRIGRVAVIAEWRGKQVGRALMRTVMETASNMHMEYLRLASQVQAIAFYEDFGFRAEGEAFDDAGIPHRWMSCQLQLEPVNHRQPGRLKSQLPANATAQPREFQGLGEYRQAVLDLLTATTNQLLIYSRDLEPLVLGEPAIVQQIQRLANGAAQPQIRIIVQDPDTAIKEGHLLLPLAQRKPGVIDFRLPSKDFKNYPSAFMVGDAQHGIYRDNGGYPAGELHFAERTFARPLCDYFSRVWDFGRHDSNFRALNL